MTATRRLAAILAADVAGYSRLIGADEGGTLSVLKAIRAELIDPTIAAHNGRLVKTTGDGLVVEFGSVVDALGCATEVQAGLAEPTATAPADKRIEFRIGIKWGTSSSRTVPAYRKLLFYLIVIKIAEVFPINPPIPQTLLF
jgi:class 3 adenylate cyclase